MRVVDDHQRYRSMLIKDEKCEAADIFPQHEQEKKVATLIVVVNKKFFLDVGFFFFLPYNNFFPKEIIKKTKMCADWQIRWVKTHFSLFNI